MPYAHGGLCPMPTEAYAQSYLIFRSKGYSCCQSGNVKLPARAWEREECDRMKARVSKEFAISRGINTIGDLRFEI